MSIRQSRDETMMMVAEAFGRRGTCSRLQVGAVISRDGRIISTGYNGRPSGMKHCDHSCDCDTYLVHSDDCASVQPCRYAVHAEANAIAFAARYGVSVLKAELHITHQPCLDCAKMIINSGIIRVVFEVPYRDSAGLDLLNEIGMKTMWYT